MMLSTPLASAFRALVASQPKTPAAVQSLTRADLPKASTVKQSPGACDTVVRVKYSNINYKDALVAVGKYPGLKPPRIGGIDLVGEIAETSSSGYSVGQKVLLNGWGIGHDHDGGFSQEASVKSDWILPLPANLSALDAARIGTAGYTAMLCILALENGGLTPSAGPVAVTGATGGVGSVAISILAKLGYEVHALTGKAQEEPYLKSLGAAGILLRSEFSAEKPTPLGKEKFAGVVDAVGGNVVANLLPLIKYNGGVACCGLAGGMNLNTTVAPLILRGVTIHGVESVFMKTSTRIEAYDRLQTDLTKDKLDLIAGGENVIGLEEVVGISKKVLAGEVTGRYVVDVDK